MHRADTMLGMTCAHYTRSGHEKVSEVGGLPRIGGDCDRRLIIAGGQSAVRAWRRPWPRSAAG